MTRAEYWSMYYDPAYMPGWWLGGIRDTDGHHIDERVFSRGQRLSNPEGLTLPLYPFGEEQRRVRLPLRVEIMRPGRQTDLSLAGIGAPMVSARLARVFRDHAADDIELFPLAAGEEAEPVYSVLNATRLVDALDRERSVIQYWPSDDPALLVGKPAYVSKMVIRVEAVAGVSCFRAQDWSSDLIVSKALMRDIKGLNAPEIAFEPV